MSALVDALSVASKLVTMVQLSSSMSWLVRVVAASVAFDSSSGSSSYELA